MGLIKLQWGLQLQHQMYGELIMSGKRYKEAKKLLNDSEVLSVEKAIS